MKRTLLIILTILAGLTVRGQCNQQLVDLAISHSGEDAIFVREFKVKLKAGNSSKPLPVGHFTIMLKEGSNYRFNIENASEYEGKAIMQIYDRNILLGSTYNSEIRKDNKSFEFQCTKTTTYQVLISFREAKEGCAVGVVSLIDKKWKSESIENDTLYEILYTEIANPLELNVQLKPEQKIELSIDSGRINKVNDAYEVYVNNNTEWATIKLSVLDSDNKAVLTKSTTFKVEKLPLPTPFLARKNTNMITKDDILSYPVMELNIPYIDDISKFQIIDYIFSTSGNYNEEIVCRSGNLGYNVIKRVNGLMSGDKIFIRQMHVQLPGGKIVTLPDFTYFIEK